MRVLTKDGRYSKGCNPAITHSRNTSIEVRHVTFYGKTFHEIENAIGILNFYKKIKKFH